MLSRPRSRESWSMGGSRGMMARPCGFDTSSTSAGSSHGYLENPGRSCSRPSFSRLAFFLWLCFTGREFSSSCSPAIRVTRRSASVATKFGNQHRVLHPPQVLLAVVVVELVDVGNCIAFLFKKKIFVRL